MTQTGDLLENAIAERKHQTIKEKFTDDRKINFCNIDAPTHELVINKLY